MVSGTLFRYIDHENETLRPFIQASFAYQTYGGYRAYLSDTESIGAEYTAYGDPATLGVEYSPFAGVTLIAGFNSGLAHLESEADYKGAIVSNYFRPALAGYLFDWDVEAWLSGVSAGLEYKKIWGRYELRGLVDVSYNHFETYDSSSSYVDFEADATTCALLVEGLMPMPVTLGKLPLFLVANLGHTSFYGEERDALGFTSFYEAGLALETDISTCEWRVKKLRLGAKAMAGEDVVGWSLILGYRF